MDCSSSQPLVSVIAVSYNHERWVLETLKSIKSQSFTDFELIYCDDASQDGSIAVATDWLDSHANFPVKKILHNENQGLCRTLNEAIGLCCGKYVQMVACDDALLPEKLSWHVPILESANESVCTVYSDAKLIDSNSNQVGRRFVAHHRPDLTELPSGDLLDELIRGNFIPAMSALTRRSSILDVGGYDESIRLEDYDMWLRLARRFQFVNDNRPSVLYRLHDDNLHKRLKLYLDHYWVFKKHLDVPEMRRTLLRMAVNWQSDAVAVDSVGMRDFLHLLQSDSVLQHELSAVCCLPKWTSDLGVSCEMAQLRLAREKQDLQVLKDELRRLQGSISFRLACALTSPVRAILSIVHRFSRSDN
jgi:glycosyltransferase involved in cell wall biosynthesis